MSDLVATRDDSADAKLRLLVCKVCHSIQPLPDYQGRDIDRDETLLARVAEHQYPGSQRGHDMELLRVSETSWNDPGIRRQITAEMGKHIGLGEGEGLGSELYDVRNNYSDDAMACWRFKHNRTTDCGDYMKPHMAVLSDSKADRKDLGLDPKARPAIMVCQFCVIHSLVEQKKRKAKGLYN